MEISRVEQPDDPSYKEFIINLDQDFIPPLSLRSGGIDAFIETVFRNGGRTWLARDESGPVGGLSFWLTDENLVYFWFIGVRADLRSTLLGGRIILKLMSTALQAYERENPGNAAGMQFTTWESNSAAIRLYRLLGFNVVGKKENDMVEGRTTLLYEGEYSLVRERLMRLTHGFCP